MKYTITITQVGLEETVIGKSWQVIAKDTDNRDVYGYTPETTATRKVDQKIYEQTVESMDIPAVIIAVNKLVNVGQRTYSHGEEG